MLHFVIMAGGTGTRFWPKSRLAQPKQLLPLASDRSMLQMTVDRLGDLAQPQNTFILTAAVWTEAVAKQLPDLPRQQILGEPCKRDTAPCIGLAALLLLLGDPDATMIVMPSDQVIAPADQFQQCLQASAAIVGEEPQRIVTFGIKPTYPATTFGYIEKGEAVSFKSKPSSNAFSVFEVKKFREKPPSQIAKEYLATGNFFWNSGIFVWKAATIVSALQQRQPEMLARLQTIVAAWGKPDFDQVFAREFAAIKGISIDYAVMEHAQDVAVIEWSHAWSDVGGWQAAAKLWPTKPDDAGNLALGRHLTVDSKNCILRSDDEHLIATIGVNDLIVVHTPDATLVANRNDEESIRRIVKVLEERGWAEYL
ncbi:MAG TPA: sugar phosphate nucleotidyltransferase [Pirellulales bacterium]